MRMFITTLFIIMKAGNQDDLRLNKIESSDKTVDSL